MKPKILCWLLIVLCPFAYAGAEMEIPDTFPPQMIELEAFTFSIDFDWRVKELTPDDVANSVLFYADSVNGLQNLMVFAGAEGDYDTLYEQTAKNEYAGIAKREETQVYNSIEILFTSSEETDSATAYISHDGNTYSFLLRNTQQEGKASEAPKPLETLQGFLHSLMLSVQP